MSSPSLVGGIALRAYDLPGSIAFAAAYGLLLPAFVYRLVDRRSRTVILFQVISFAVERFVSSTFLQPSTDRLAESFCFPCAHR